MYFAILWKHNQISLKELQIIEPIFLPSTKKGIVLFDTKYPEKLGTLGGCIKSGVVVAEKELQVLLKDIKIIGVQEEAIGKHFKRTIGIRRFKKVNLNHTDKEIKEKGKEIINLDNGKYGIVEHYQNIPLYETIDFEKPARSMHMGMMPAKLTHILINLALNTQESKQNITIYDPFCWSGTTNFLANALWYTTLWSDINTNHAEQNLTRRNTNKFCNKDIAIYFFHHDSTKEFPKSQLQGQNNRIVTEWRLGPIIRKNSSEREIKNAQQQIERLYTNFFTNSIQSGLFSTIICTIPRYIGQSNPQEKQLETSVKNLGYQRKSIDEVYHRPDQQVWRKICILKKEG
jgi:tRNA G10  N-methylase Trm11